MPPFPSLLLDLSDSPGALPRVLQHRGQRPGQGGMRGSGALEREFRAGKSGRSSHRC